MITPEWLSAAIDKLEVHKRLQDTILKAVARRLVKTNFDVTDASKWQIEKLQQSGMLYDEIVTAIAQETKALKSEIETAFDNAGAEVFNYPEEDLEKAGLVPNELKNLSPQMKGILAAAAAKTFTEAKNLVRTTANMTQHSYINACELAHQQIVSGAFSYTQAIANAIKQAACESGYVHYPSGARTTVEAAVRRAVLTGVNQTAAELQMKLADEMECDLVEVSAHFGARPNHAEWQGQVYSRSGKHPDYDSFDVCGYGTAEGLCGVNCRHGFYLFFEGISKRAYTDKELSDMKNAAVTVDGEQMPLHKAIGQQRAYERAVRKEKVRLVALAEAHKASGDNRYSADFDREAARLKEKERQLAAWCEKTGLTHESSRVQVYGFDRSLAQRAVYGSKRELAKYTKYLYNKDGTVYVTDKMSRTVLKYKPFAVVDVVRKGGGVDRNIYDQNGYQIKQVSNHNHGTPKLHPFGKNGEHTHDYVWTDGIVNRHRGREMTDTERKEHSDLL